MELMETEVAKQRAHQRRAGPRRKHSRQGRASERARPSERPWKAREDVVDLVACLSLEAMSCNRSDHMFPRSPTPQLCRRAMNSEWSIADTPRV